MKNTILHFVKNYLQLSETFIYNELLSLKDFNSIVLTRNLINKDVFPFEPIFIMDKNWDKQVDYSRVKLIHARFGEGGMIMMPTAKKLGLPLITSFYGIDVSRHPRHFNYRRKLKRLFKEGSMFFVQSENMKKDVIKLGCESSKIEVVYTGIDISKFKLKDYSSITDKVNILMYGRFVEKKGMEYGIKAFASLKNKNAKLLIIGDGQLRKQLESLVKSLNIQKDVTFYGLCSHSRAIEILHTSDILLAPHITAHNGDKEGMPTTIKEAMATGLPVVATNHSGIPESVTDGENGFLVPEKDVLGLREKLDWLIEHREVWKTFGKKGRVIVEGKFSLSNEAEKIKNLYQKF